MLTIARTAPRPSFNVPNELPPAAETAQSAARTARTLAPTIYCPESQVDECLRQESEGANR